MEITKQDFKAYLKTLFLCLLLLLITFNFELKFTTTTVAFSITGLVGAIILIVRTNKYKNVSKEFNTMYLTSIGIVGAIVLNPLLQLLITNIAFKDALNEMMYHLSVFIEAGDSLTIPQVNAFLQSLGGLSSYVVIICVVSMLLTYGPVVYLYLSISKLVKAYCETNNVDDAYLLAKQTKKTAIYHAIPPVLAVICIASSFNVLSSIQLTEQDFVFAHGVEFSAFLIFVSGIALLVFAIADLVQIIKCLIRIHKFTNDPVLND